jgi:hypothetical protein
MKTNITVSPLKYWVASTLATRAFGHTYIHKKMRGIDYCHSHVTGDMTFIWGSYGRSLAGGGHKYKVRAVYTATAQPVPTKILKSL